MYKPKRSVRRALAWKLLPTYPDRKPSNRFGTVDFRCFMGKIALDQWHVVAGNGDALPSFLLHCCVHIFGTAFWVGLCLECGGCRPGGSGRRRNGGDTVVSPTTDVPLGDEACIEIRQDNSAGSCTSSQAYTSGANFVQAA